MIKRAHPGVLFLMVVWALIMFRTPALFMSLMIVPIIDFFYANHIEDKDETDRVVAYIYWTNKGIFEVRKKLILFNILFLLTFPPFFNVVGVLVLTYFLGWKTSTMATMEKIVVESFMDAADNPPQ